MPPPSGSRAARAITAAEARRVFRAQRAAFAGFHAPVILAKLYVVDRRCPEPGRCAYRDLAWMQRGNVYLLRRALRMGRDVVAALLAHELGHAVDPWVWLPGSEQRADDIAEMVLGQRVRYTRVTRVQTFGPGLYPRPEGLHA